MPWVTTFGRQPAADRIFKKQQVAAQVGIPYRRLSNILTGSSWGSPGDLQRIADWIGAPVEKLFTEELRNAPRPTKGQRPNDEAVAK
ncbi:helix-turn-helix domain-containing protein [Aestuariimicrobium sp. T2.26MG-19.2B]|uniref:helix-turn-helix domain-containing protein n=1 Tax=Aestuariimicrobium sp. T2.26MG-19.2B TaxID=3040679 RepID=UPI0024779C85|nr:helix-turn-helix transcriptional regulator [Aestuariimicrobium sp. T2.26MG-19.2B]CAI9400390.1 hypothetical protein AESSP_00378 [Aestuariimicrobium sp. T2.26MG-19.2B]